MQFSTEAPNNEEKFRQVLDTGFRIVKERYGSGDGDGFEPHKYHNLVHTKKVVSSIEKMADMAISEGKITRRDKELLMIAGCFHDVEQDMGRDNEDLSAEVAEREMINIGRYTDKEIETVKRLIVGTKCYWTEEGCLVQRADGSNLMEAIMADADMNNAGEDWETFVQVSLNLAEEIYKKDKLSSDDMKSFWESQLKFLKKRAYFTSYASTLFPNIKSNTERVLENLRKD